MSWWHAATESYSIEALRLGDESQRVNGKQPLIHAGTLLSSNLGDAGDGKGNGLRKVPTLNPITAIEFNLTQSNLTQLPASTILKASEKVNSLHLLGFDHKSQQLLHLNLSLAQLLDKTSAI